jgi:copper resistance protein B
MSRWVLVGLAASLLTAPALAQTLDPHAGHHMPPAQPAADPHAGHRMTPADPHAGHRMGPAQAADPHAGHAPAAPAGGPPTAADLPVGDAPPPPAATRHAADALFPAADMARARAILRREHGGARVSKTLVETLEWRPGGRDGYAWAGAFRYGGDRDRLVLKSEGEGENGGLEHAEVQALYSRAVGPYFDLQAGVRQDLEPRPRRSYATVGIEGLAPYWFEVEGALFLSDRGGLSARLGGSYDLRLTQRLILEPRVEASLAASDDAAVGVGRGLSDAEAGLRLRYEVRREFAPYVGVSHARRFGRTADYARAEGESRDDTRLTVGLRAWF